VVEQQPLDDRLVKDVAGDGQPTGGIQPAPDRNPTRITVMSSVPPPKSKTTTFCALSIIHS